REVASPVIVSTLTTLIVFLPLMFMQGNETLSFYLSHIGFPVGVGLLASLFLSLVLIPLVAVWVFPSRAGAIVVGNAPAPGAGATTESSAVRAWVRTLAAWTLRRPADAVLLILALLVATWLPFQKVTRFDEVD